MTTRTAEAHWDGDIKTGSGTIQLESGAFEGNYSFSTRFDNAPGTNPEELVAAAHAGCYSMALSHALTEAGFTVDWIDTRAAVHIEKQGNGFAIPRIDLTTEASVEGIDEATYKTQAEEAKRNCPISKLLAGAEITLNARLSTSPAPHRGADRQANAST